jgi:hypothetical protein
VAVVDDQVRMGEARCEVCFPQTALSHSLDRSRHCRAIRVRQYCVGLRSMSESDRRAKRSPRNVNRALRVDDCLAYRGGTPFVLSSTLTKRQRQGKVSNGRMPSFPWRLSG